MTVRIRREENFELSHILDGYNGKCGRLHGHRYCAKVTLEGNIDPESGMIMDFGDLKPIINEIIPDHYYISNSSIEEGFQKDMRNILDKYNIDYKTMPFRTTAENMVGWFANKIQEKLPADVFVVRVELWETEKNNAEWRIEDNLTEEYINFKKNSSDKNMYQNM